MKKPKEQFEWVDITSEEAQGLADNAPELLRLLKSIPDTSPLNDFLFPTHKLKEKKVTTKSRFLAMCRALGRTKSPSGLYARAERIQKAFSAPANPCRFHRFVETFKAHAQQSLLYPIALDLKSKVTSLRATQYLGHPNLDTEAWFGLGVLGRTLADNFSKDGGKYIHHDGIYPDTVDNALEYCTPSQKLYMQLKKQAYQDNVPAAKQTAQFLSDLDRAISSFPNVRQLDPYTALQLTHILDVTNNLYRPGGDAVHQNNLFFFTDGAHLMYKVGVYCSDRVARAVPETYYRGRVRKSFCYRPRTRKKAATEDKIYYAMLDLVSMTPRVFDFDNFIQVGDPLPEKGGKYFTVATFDFKPKESNPLPAALQTVTNGILCEAVNTQASRARASQHISFEFWASHNLPSACLSSNHRLYPSDLACNQFDTPRSLLSFYTAQQRCRNTQEIIEPESLYWHIENSVRDNRRNVINFSHSSRVEDTNFTNLPIPMPFIHAHCPDHSFSLLTVSSSTPGISVHKPSEANNFFTRPVAQEKATIRPPFDATESRDPASMPEYPYAPLLSSDLSDPMYQHYYGEDQVKLLREKKYGPLILAESVTHLRHRLPLPLLSPEAFDPLLPELASFAFFITLPGILLPPTSTPSYSTQSMICGSADFGYTVRDAYDVLLSSPSPSLSRLVSANARTSELSNLQSAPGSACISTIVNDLINQPAFSVTLAYRLSPFVISEGTIHLSPSINSLNVLAKWGKVLRGLTQSIQERETELVNAAREDAVFFAPRTVASRYRELTKTTEQTVPESTGGTYVSN